MDGVRRGMLQSAVALVVALCCPISSAAAVRPSSPGDHLLSSLRPRGLPLQNPLPPLSGLSRSVLPSLTLPVTARLPHSSPARSTPRPQPCAWGSRPLADLMGQGPWLSHRRPPPPCTSDPRRLCSTFSCALGLSHPRKQPAGHCHDLAPWICGRARPGPGLGAGSGRGSPGTPEGCPVRS